MQGTNSISGDRMILPEPMELLTAKQWEDMGLSRAQFEARWSARVRRDEQSPVVGSIAPNFELEILSPHGQRTGRLFRLSSLFGKPIGLVFGSYT